ncbi:MAG: TIGR03936 family radical SAM-associated protein [Oscillospiraceae bacterium]|nr:TIGR03936 family radical SAM-associated protein [Oscillospiraceae bacterium]
MSHLNVRLAYQKTGRAKYISHLDLMRVFARAFARLKIPLRFSEGFNPHPYLSIAMPLGVGIESLCERLDFGISQAINIGSLPYRLNAELPAGIRAEAAVIGGRPFAQIAFAEYKITVETNIPPNRIHALFTSTVIVSKRSKKKAPVPTDIVPMIKNFSCVRFRDGIQITALLASQNPSLNPEYIAEGFRQYLDPEASFDFVRTALFDAAAHPFDALAGEGNGVCSYPPKN